MEMPNGLDEKKWAILVVCNNLVSSCLRLCHLLLHGGSDENITNTVKDVKDSIDRFLSVTSNGQQQQY